MRTQELARAALFAALIAICSWISIPTAVPFTLQTFAVFLALGVLGGKLGTLSVAVYLLLGAVGLPVFAGFQGGLGALLGATGGYLAGFLLTALTVWGAERWDWPCATCSARCGSRRCMPPPPALWGWSPCWGGACSPSSSPTWPSWPWPSS